MSGPIVKYNNKLRWTFDNLSKWDQTMRYSDEVEIENLKWKIGISVKEKYLYQILNCSIDGSEKAWVCAVDATFSLLRQSGDTDHYQKTSATTQYLTGKNDHSPSQGPHSIYIKDSTTRFKRNDSIIIEFAFDYSFYNVSKSIPNYTDVVLKVGDVDLHLNKGFLSTVSKHFLDLFVTKKCDNESVVIENVDLSAFMKFLLFLHPTHVKLSEYHQDDTLLQMANEYGVKSIHWKNEEYMITESNLSAIEQFKYAEKYGYAKLTSHVIKSLDKLDKIKQVVKAVEFEELSKEVRKRVLCKLVSLL